jgi:3-phenylpropionate/trans-cinnamate dioxygenase ferredoxin component
MNKMDDFVTVAQVSDIPPGQVKVVAIDGREIGIANIDGNLYAFANICTHDDGPVAEGELDGSVIVCPRHGARFDVTTGAVLSFPAVVPIPVYDLKVEGTQVQVRRTPRT